jgi:hypothetical protein
LIGQEDGSSNSALGDYFSTSATGTTPPSNRDVTWVPVKNAHASQAWISGSRDLWFNRPDLNGYAIYRTEVWNDAKGNYKDGKSSLADAEAPDPLMFLPAAGLRKFGAVEVYYVGSIGTYWSSVVDGSNSYTMVFEYNRVSVQSTEPRLTAMSIRCVSESTVRGEEDGKTKN